MNPKNRKTWIFRILAICVVVVLGLAIAGKIHDSQLTDAKREAIKLENKKIFGEAYFGKEFAVCPKNLSGLFTKAPLDVSLIDFVVPLGNMNASSHTIPTDHTYMNYVAPAPQRYPVYAPANLTVLTGDNKVTYFSDTNKIKEDDYSLEFVVCRGLTMYLNHFSELSPALSLAYKHSKPWCDKGKYHFGDDMTTYYSPCQYDLGVKIKVGELIGYVGGLQHQQGLDIGLYNHNAAPLAYISPQRYSEDNLHAACPFDIFTPALKAAYYKKIGDWATLTKDKGVLTGGHFVPRTVEPICGENMFDILGTARGNWFAGTVKMGSVTQSQYMMALAPYNFDPTQLKISIKGPKEVGGYVDMVFTPTHSGTYNRDFAEVKADGQIYCYRWEPISSGAIGKDGRPLPDVGPKIILQLVDTTHLKIENQSGGCSPHEQFQNPFLFQR